MSDTNLAEEFKHITNPVKPCRKNSSYAEFRKVARQANRDAYPWPTEGIVHHKVEHSRGPLTSVM